MDVLDPETRAERLRVGLLLFGLVYEPPSDAIDGACATELLTAEEWEEWREADEEDLALAAACLGVEYGLRARQWSALQRLGELHAAGEGDDAEARWLSLPDRDVAEVLRHASALGWTHDPPEPGE